MNHAISIQILVLLVVSCSVSGFAPNGRISRTNAFIVPMSEEDSTSVSFDTAEEVPKASVKCPNCNLCDGSGRIIGGLGAIELFSWWPIKAYRPCPNFIENGGQYVRSGQGLDEIAFGRDSTYTPE